MSMIEHAVGVVSLDRFVEISHMDHDEIGALLLDTMAENNKLRTFLGGNSIVTDYWKDEDGTMHVLTTDGEHTYEYMRGGLAEENAKLRELVCWMYDRMDESCAVHHTHAPTPISYDLLMKALALVHELGIEVDG